MFIFTARSACHRLFPKRFLSVQSGNAAATIWPCFKNVTRFAEKTAISDETGKYLYSDVFFKARELSKEISHKLMGRTNEKVLFMCPNNVNYVVTLWAIWMSGQIAVPLSPLHPHNLLLYYANDCRPKLLIASTELIDKVEKLARNNLLQVLTVKEAKAETHEKLNYESIHPPEFYLKNDALILYTSGTTGNPKGVVLTHKNLHNQVSTLLSAWFWSSNDVILHTLPLNHVHGIINALLCPLTIGAEVVFSKFTAKSVWTRLLGAKQKPGDKKVTVYMAVPTIYCSLIEEYENLVKNDEKIKESVRKTLKTKIRLMVSGSAPLPETVFKQWLEISGHNLLERYGMTEIGMCLSNPYSSKREPGYVGTPLPGVNVKICQRDEKGNFSPMVSGDSTETQLLVSDPKPSGQLLVKSDSVFREYLNRPEATKEVFSEDGYFITGDICQYDATKKLFKILGRESVDIIKTGGYKLSALHIETQLLNNEDIKECAVVGVPDEKWGEKVAAILVLNSDKSMTVEELKQWSFNKLPKYSIPSIIKIVPNIPKNAMGKVNKKELRKELFAKD